MLHVTPCSYMVLVLLAVISGAQCIRETLKNLEGAKELYFYYCKKIYLCQFNLLVTHDNIIKKTNQQ